MPDSHRTTPDPDEVPSDDPLEEVIAEVLVRAEAEGSEALEAACRAHPEEEAEIRSRVAALRGFGLVGSGGPAPATAGEVASEWQLVRDAAAGAGREIGPYRLIRELGRGGQAEVHLAEDTRLGRPVALKLLSIPGLASESALARFRREAELTSRLDHSGICPVYEAGVASGVPFIAMRYVEGATLAARLAADRDRETPEAVRGHVALVARAARALHVAHQAGVLHRDIKPGNIMVGSDGAPVILDFGLARAAEEESGAGLTATGDVFGTPAYMSPEQVRGEPSPLDRRTDVWSLGVVLFEGLAGARPFTGPTRESLHHAILGREPEDLRRLNRSAGRDLAVVAATALQKERDRRYQTAADLAADLEAVLERRPIAARPASLAIRTARWARRHPAAAVLAIVLAVGLPSLAGLAGFLAARWPELERGAAELARERIEAGLEAAYRLLGDGDVDEALPEFERVLAESPGQAEAVAGIMLAGLRARRYDDAIRAFERHVPSGAAPPALVRLHAEVLRKARRGGGAAGPVPAEDAAASALDAFLLGTRELEAAHGGDRRAARRSVEQFTRAIMASPRPRPLYFQGRARAAGFAEDADAARETAALLTRHWPDSPGSWFYAGIAISRIDPEAASRHFQAAIDRSPEGNAEAANNLGFTLAAAGRHEEAIPAYRESLRLRPKSARTQANLGTALLETGRLAEAAEAFRASRRFGTHFGVEEKLRDADRALALVPKLEAVRAGSERPATPAEGFELARIAFWMKSVALAAALYREALGPEPEPGRAELSRAVCAAACAGTGMGDDVAGLDDAARAAWRAQALAWLRIDLAGWKARLAEKKAAAGEVRMNLVWWSRDPHLAPFVAGRGLETLPPPEREAWTAFWSDADAVLASLR